MSRIPSDISDTMWQIAERRDHQAAKEFTEKFPALAQDMRDRMRMIGGMKDMRTAVAPGFVPAFKPKYMGNPTRRWKRFLPAGLGIAALAAASFYVTQNVLTPLPDVTPTSKAAAPDQAKANSGDLDLPSLSPTQNPDATSPRPFIHNSDTSTPGDKAPVEISMGDVPLHTAIRAIARSWSLSIEIPPSTPNPTIHRIDIFGKNGMDFLNQLGEQHGFTVFDEGHGHVLVVPAAKDPEPAPDQPSN